jgi:hypothetical protein
MPQNQPVLAPKVQSQPINQPTLNPTVQSKPANAGQAIQTSIPPVVKGINGARLDGHTDEEILAQYIHNHPESQAPQAIAAGHSASDILDAIVQGQGYQARKPGDNVGQDQPNDNSLNIKTFHGDVGALVGAAKGVTSTIAGLVTLGAKTGNAIAGKGFQVNTDPNSFMGRLNEVTKARGYGENVGKIGEQIAEFFIPGGAEADVLKAADAGIEGLKLAEKAGVLGKGVAKAFGIGSRATVGGLSAAGVTALQTGGDPAQTKTAAILGSIFPGASAIADAIAGKFAPRLVNSLIKPLSKDFEFGKNPGNAVVSEGIKATTWEGLIGSIKNIKNAVGKQIGQVLSHPEVEKQSVSIANALSPIDEAIQNATRQGDQALINKLLEFRDGLTKEYGLVEGKLVETGSKTLDVAPKQALKIKGDIGDSVRWREGIDSEVNKVKVKVYQNIRDQIEQAVNLARKVDPTIADISPLNNRYANLTTAEAAAQYRRNIVSRLNLSSLTQKGTLLLGAGAVGKDIVTGNTKDIPRDAAIGLGGYLGEKVLSGVGGKTYGAQIVKNSGKLVRGLGKAALGANSSIKH